MRIATLSLKKLRQSRAGQVSVPGIVSTVSAQEWEQMERRTINSLSAQQHRSVKCYAVLLGIFVCSVLHGAGAVTNKLSIHLLADKTAWNRTADPYGLKVTEHPILSDVDFVAFNTTSHTFTITAEAAKRLVTMFDKGDPSFKSSGETYYAWSGGPVFVLMASGEPIYAGVFDSPYSSVQFEGIPTVLPSDGHFSIKAFTNATFRIGLGFPQPTQSDVDLSRPMGFHLPADQALDDYWRKIDVRNDSRIVSAVKALFARPK